MKKIFYSAALALLSTNALAQPCITPNLVANWEFNSGSTTETIHGWATTGLGGGMVFPVAGANGVANTALKFNAARLSIPYDPLMNLPSFTIAAVVRIDDIYNGCNIKNIISRGMPATNQYSLNYSKLPVGCPPINGSNEVFAAKAAGVAPFPDSKFRSGSVAFQPSINYITGQWYCVIVMYDAVAEQMNFYVNGKHILSEYWSNQFSPTNDGIFIGQPNSIISLDDIKIFDGVFSCPQDIVAQCPDICPDDPIAHWTFDNTPDDIINGWSPISTGGTPSYTTGISGVPNTAMHFNGTDFLRFASDPIMNVNTWTISAIVRPTDFNPTRGKSACEVGSVLWRGNHGGSEHYTLAYTDNDVDYTCGVISPNDNIFTVAAAGAPPAPGAWSAPANPANPFLVAGQWYCVVATYDAAIGQLRFYVNGTLTTVLPWTNSYSYATANDLYIGSSNMGAPWLYFFNGDIDDIQLYNVALDPACFPACGSPRPKSTGVEKMEKKALNIVPNPANDVITVEIDNNMNNTNYTLTNSVGAVVKTGLLQGNSTKIDVKTLPAGLYIIGIQSDGKIETRKVVINY